MNKIIKSVFVDLIVVVNMQQILFKGEKKAQAKKQYQYKGFVGEKLFDGGYQERSGCKFIVTKV